MISTVLQSCIDRSKEAFGIAVMATLFKTSNEDDDTMYNATSKAVPRVVLIVIV